MDPGKVERLGLGDRVLTELAAVSCRSSENRLGPVSSRRDKQLEKTTGNRTEFLFHKTKAR